MVKYAEKKLIKIGDSYGFTVAMNDVKNGSLPLEGTFRIKIDEVK